MKDLKKALRYLESIGFLITYNDGTRRKVFPPDKSKPFYSLHVGELAVKPFFRFAAKEWGIDLKEKI